MRWSRRATTRSIVLTGPGAGESGKSTVLKQMRLIHTKGFQLPERKQWKVTIFQNLLHAFQVVFGAMEEQEVDFANEGNIVRIISMRRSCRRHTDATPAVRRSHRRRPGDWPRRLDAIGLSERIHAPLARRRRAVGHQEGQRIRAARQPDIVRIPPTSVAPLGS